MPPKEREIAIVQFAQVLPINHNPAAVGQREAGHQVQQRALARAARSHDRQELPLRHFQRDTRQRGDGFGALLKILRDVVDDQW